MVGGGIIIEAWMSTYHLVFVLSDYCNFIVNIIRICVSAENFVVPSAAGNAVD